MASSVKWLAKRAPSPDSADSVKSFNNRAKSSPVMSPPFAAHWKLQAWAETITFVKLEGTRALFRGFRHDRRRHASQPAIDELLQPGALGHVMYRTIGEVVVARARARQFEARMAARGPAMHHRVSHVGMKLEAEAMIQSKRFHREVASLRQQFGARGKFKSLAVPVVDMIGPVRADLEPRARGADRVISDLRTALPMRRNPGAELHGEHLRPQANPQKRPLLPERDGDPVDLLTDEIVGIVRAHRAAENHRAGMAIQRFRQGIAKTRTPDVQPVPERPQRIADAARGRGFLMQDDQHRQQGFGG